MLAARQIGRLGVFLDQYPLIVPVNYSMDGDAVVIRTHPIPWSPAPTTPTSRSRSMN